MNRNPTRGSTLVLSLVFAVVFTAIIIFFIKFKSGLIPPPSQNSQSSTETSDFKSYTSQDLGISFKYPKDWFVNEKDYEIMLTSYETEFGENRSPGNNQLKMFINMFSNCFPDYEKDLIYPGCGEGGEASKNTIISKEGRPVQAGTFYKYVVRTPRNDEFVYYILYKDDKNIFQVEKHPDPSQFEKEFEEIVNSIKIL